ncbi:MAG: ABC transporter ATP-binding protein [Rudaea sp.]
MAAASPRPVKGQNGETIIHTSGLSKEFRGEYAVQDVTFDIPRGTIFGFIGPSGSGKTTTIRLLTGLVRPSAGEISVFGRPPFRFRTRIRERIGYMPQLFALYPELTVWENLNFAASIYGMGPFRGKRLHDVLNFVELDAHRNKLAREISGGMQRRLSLAATLLHKPELIFLDEPTAGIDPILRAKFWEHFQALKEAGRTLFITTQYVSEAANCDSIGLMSEGHLIAADSPEGLRRKAYGGDIIELRTATRLSYDLLQKLEEVPGVRPGINRDGEKGLRVGVVDAAAAIPDIVEWCRQNNIEVDSIAPYQPPFEDVFVDLVNNASAEQEAAATITEPAGGPNQ